jgi:hypothetical protein
MKLNENLFGLNDAQFTSVSGHNADIEAFLKIVKVQDALRFENTTPDAFYRHSLIEVEDAVIKEKVVYTLLLELLTARTSGSTDEGVHGSTHGTNRCQS